MSKIAIYGSYGYTGQLIVEELAKTGFDLILSGRNSEKLEAQATEAGLPFECVDLSNTAALEALLSKIVLVVHCAGPFSHTALLMAEACMKTATHYLDITGEYGVFEALQKKDEEAKKANVMVLPGAGFDVVPTDCLANYLSEKATHPEALVLAFATKGGGLSRGTSKTMIEGITDGHVYRQDGELKRTGLGKDVRSIDYGPFVAESMGISWGDISTAYFSTHIPSIRVYSATKKKQIRFSRLVWTFRSLMGSSFVQDWLKKKVDKNPPGPGAKHLEQGRSYLFGEVKERDGTVRRARLTTPNGYRLTAMAVAHICQQVSNGEWKSGYQTPASAYGWTLITDITGTSIEDISK